MEGLELSTSAPDVDLTELQSDGEADTAASTSAGKGSNSNGRPLATAGNAAAFSSSANVAPPVHSAKPKAAAVGSSGGMTVKAKPSRASDSRSSESGSEDEGVNYAEACWECRKSRAFDNNAIAFCDACQYGFHQRCHGGALQHFSPSEDVTWYCKYCKPRGVNKRNWSRLLAAPNPGWSMAFNDPYQMLNDDGPTPDYKAWLSQQLKQDPNFVVVYHWFSLFGHVYGLEAVSFVGLEGMLTAPGQSGALAEIHVEILKALGRAKANKENWTRVLAELMFDDDYELAFRDAVKLGKRLAKEAEPIRKAQAKARAALIAASASSATAGRRGGSNAAAGGDGSSESKDMTSDISDDDDGDAAMDGGGNATNHRTAGAAERRSKREQKEVDNAAGEAADGNGGDDAEDYDYYSQPVPVRLLLLKTLCEEALTCGLKSNKAMQDYLRLEFDTGAGAGAGAKASKAADADIIGLDGLRAAEAPVASRPLFQASDLLTPLQSRPPMPAYVDTLMLRIEPDESPLLASASSAVSRGVYYLPAALQAAALAGNGSTADGTSATVFSSPAKVSSSSAAAAGASTLSAATSSAAAVICMPWAVTQVAELAPPKPKPAPAVAAATTSAAAVVDVSIDEATMSSMEGPTGDDAHGSSSEAAAAEAKSAPSLSMLEDIDDDENETAVAGNGREGGVPVEINVEDVEAGSSTGAEAAEASGVVAAEAAEEDEVQEDISIPADASDDRSLQYYFFQDSEGAIRFIRTRHNIPFESTPRNPGMRKLVIGRAREAVEAEVAQQRRLEKERAVLAEESRKRKEEKAAAKAAADAAAAAAAAREAAAVRLSVPKVSSGPAAWGPLKPATAVSSSAGAPKKTSQADTNQRSLLSMFGGSKPAARAPAATVPAGPFVGLAAAIAARSAIAALQAKSGTSPVLSSSPQRVYGKAGFPASSSSGPAASSTGTSSASDSVNSVTIIDSSPVKPSVAATAAPVAPDALEGASRDNTPPAVPAVTVPKRAPIPLVALAPRQTATEGPAVHAAPATGGEGLPDHADADAALQTAAAPAQVTSAAVIDMVISDDEDDADAKAALVSATRPVVPAVSSGAAAGDVIDIDDDAIDSATKASGSATSALGPSSSSTAAPFASHQLQTKPAVGSSLSKLQTASSSSVLHSSSDHDDKPMKAKKRKTNASANASDDEDGTDMFQQEAAPDVNISGVGFATVSAAPSAPDFTTLACTLEELEGLVAELNMSRSRWDRVLAKSLSDEVLPEARKKQKALERKARSRMNRELGIYAFRERQPLPSETYQSTGIYATRRARSQVGSYNVDALADAAGLPRHLK